MKDEELGDHIMIYCSFTRFIWDCFLVYMSLKWVMLYCFINHVKQWNCDLLDVCGKKFWMRILHDLCWGIWKERNKGIFEGVRKSPWQVADSILFEEASWAIASKNFNVLFVNNFTRDWYSCIFSYFIHCNP